MPPSTWSRIRQIIRHPIKSYGRRRIDPRDAHDPNSFLYKYPRLLLIYEQPPSSNARVGLQRLSNYFGPIYCIASIFNDHYLPALMAILPAAAYAYFNNFYTASHVAHAHLVLPRTARLSAESLKRYATTLPRDAELMFTGIGGLLGSQKMETVKLADLRAVRPDLWRTAQGLSAHQRKAEKAGKRFFNKDKFKGLNTYVDSLRFQYESAQYRVPPTRVVGNSRYPHIWPLVRRRVEEISVKEGTLTRLTWRDVMGTKNSDGDGVENQRSADAERKKTAKGPKMSPSTSPKSKKRNSGSKKKDG
ncbi:hypothetical protein BT63DRAFT_121999 [Microthyrium microscopicum]|uniref:Uncharacterized protein n=1 Tax=Microthyrium microscopicum TaxID=703497 RepID=A0A6A6TU18_9PEZI|nr:hypothetical protein BT63DRAFT_121999 [Microthyrium microscopicum]